MPTFTPTDEQAAILQHSPDQHARVLAGPGTGKSATMVALIEKLLASTQPPRVKLLTFTRAATGELAKKIADNPTAATERPSTIHSFAIALLLRNPGSGNFPKPLRIADGWEQDCVVFPSLARRAQVTKKFLVKRLIPEMASGWESLARVETPQVDAQTRARFVGAWQEHREVYGYTLLGELPYALREALREHQNFSGLDYDVLIVDEYQDLNACDLEILKQASERGCKIIGTGDDDQSIYGFRWAAPIGIRRFLDDYPDAADYVLSITQRCGTRIIEWANYVIQGDPDRDVGRRPLTPAVGAPVGEVALLAFADQATEAEGIAALTDKLIREKGVPQSEILILLRGDYNEQFSKPIRERLEARGIPCFDPNIVNRMLAEPNNRRLIAIMRLATNRDDSIAWATLLALTSGIGDVFVGAVYDRARDERISFGRALQDLHAEDFPEINVTLARRAKSIIESINARLDELALPDEPENGWGDWIISIATGGVILPPTAELVSLLRKLDGISEPGQDLARYIGQIGPLGRDLMQTECDGVRIMTMASSKGLTVEATIVAAVEDGVVPRPDMNLAEERRLMYVAMTRAKKYLFCTWARQRQGPTARAGNQRVGGMRHPSSFFRGGPMNSQDGPNFIRMIRR